VLLPIPSRDLATLARGARWVVFPTFRPFLSAARFIIFAVAASICALARKQTILGVNDLALRIHAKTLGDTAVALCFA
jgi:hypothetical protein